MNIRDLYKMLAVIMLFLVIAGNALANKNRRRELLPNSIFGLIFALLLLFIGIM